jgi:hypothetical protein
LAPATAIAPGGFEDGAGVLEDILDRRADGVGIDEDDLVEIFLAQAEGLLADHFHRRAVGKQPDLIQAYPLAGRQSTVSSRRHRRFRRR